MHSLWAGSRTGRPCHTLSAVPPGCHLPPARDLRESGRPQPTRSTPWYTKMFDIGAIFPPGGRQPTLGVKGRLCRTRRGPGCHRVKSCWTWSACFPAGLTLTGGTAKPGCRDSMRGDASGDLLNGSTTKCEHFSGKHWTLPASPLCCMYIYIHIWEMLPVLLLCKGRTLTAHEHTMLMRLILVEGFYAPTILLRTNGIACSWFVPSLERDEYYSCLQDDDALAREVLAHNAVRPPQGFRTRGHTYHDIRCSSQKEWSGKATDAVDGLVHIQKLFRYMQDMANKAGRPGVRKGDRKRIEEALHKELSTTRRRRSRSRSCSSSSSSSSCRGRSSLPLDCSSVISGRSRRRRHRHHYYV